MILCESDLAKFAGLLNDCKSFVLTCHTNPDGDALGSTLALRQVLINMGKEATVITPDLAPTYFSWMPGIKSLMTYERQQEECDKVIDAADVVLVMDYNDFKRVRSLGDKLLASDKKYVMIDHHTDPVAKTDVMFSVPSAAATCELVYYLLRQASLWQYVDIDVATDLYTGIMTDTGGLSYNSNDPDIYLVMAELLRCGINKPEIHDNLFNSKTMRRMHLTGYALGKKLRRIEKYPIAIITLDKNELLKYHYVTGDTEGLVNMALQIKDVLVSAFIMERPDGVKISLRSKQDFPVNEFLAEHFAGGGHLNAAGANFVGPIDEAVNRFTENIVPFYAKWLKKSAK